MAEITVKPTDSGKTLAVQSGDTLRVELPENPTTGFRWAIEGAMDAATDAVSGLSLIGDDYKMASGGMMGGGGTRILTFAAPSGASTLSLKLWQEWEGEKSVRERFALHLDPAA